MFILSAQLVMRTLFTNFMLFPRSEREAEVGSFKQQLKNRLALAMLEILDSRDQKAKMRVRRMNKKKAAYGRSPLKLLNIFI